MHVCREMDLMRRVCMLIAGFGEMREYEREFLVRDLYTVIRVLRAGEDGLQGHFGWSFGVHAAHLNTG